MGEPWITAWFYPADSLTEVMDLLPVKCKFRLNMKANRMLLWVLPGVKRKTFAFLSFSALAHTALGNGHRSLPLSGPLCIFPFHWLVSDLFDAFWMSGLCQVLSLASTSYPQCTVAWLLYTCNTWRRVKNTLWTWYQTTLLLLIPLSTAPALFFLGTFLPLASRPLCPPSSPCRAFPRLALKPGCSRSVHLWLLLCPLDTLSWEKFFSCFICWLPDLSLSPALSLGV